MSPIQLIEESEVLQRLDKAQVLESLSTAFAGLNNGRSVQPAQTVTAFPDDLGDCIFYPGALLDLGLIGVKVSPYLGELAAAGKYPVTAYTLLLSSSDGRPILLCDSYALTTVRTAATTALAVQHLAGDDAQSLALIGTGKVGREHLRFVLDGKSWDSVRLFSPSAASPGERQDLLTSEFPDTGLTFAATAADAVRDADVVMLCTSSGTPVIERDWIGPKALITSISTNVPGAHEIEPAWLSDFDVFCDYRATAPVTAGEMKKAIEEGTWDAGSIIADLPELVAGATRGASGRPAFFRSTGLGIEDLAIASLLVE